MTTMHLSSTTQGYWDSLTMFDESDLEPNKIFPPEMQRSTRDLSRTTVDILQHAESLMADDLFLDLDLEPFPLNVSSKGGDIPTNKTIIPPPPSSFGVGNCSSLHWLKQDDKQWLNFSKDLPIASTRLEDTLDAFINSISQADGEQESDDSDDYDWICSNDVHDEDQEDVYSSLLSRPLKRQKQAEDDKEGMRSLPTTSVPCVPPSLSASSSASSSSSNKSAVGGTITTANIDEVRFRGYQADQWMERFEDLRCYKAQFGNCLVPHSYPPNQQLAQWVKRQRYQYKLKIENRHSTLTVERQKELDDLGFVWDSHKAAWYERLEALKQFRAKHGNCMVPTNFTEDKPLAVWVKCQRRQLKFFRAGRQSTMTEERFVELEKLGFEWNPRNL